MASPPTDSLPFNDRGEPLSTATHKRQIYTRLQHSEIRTLLLAPVRTSGASDRKTDQLTCELSVHSQTRSTCPSGLQAPVHQYEALSYIWGPVQPTKTIMCNGVTFQITVSLYHALCRLRYQSSWRRLWVDQLCVNQDDTGEGGEVMREVGNMGRIYSGACRVVVWLGIDLNSDRPRQDKVKAVFENMKKAWTVIKTTNFSPSLVRSDFIGESPVSREASSTRKSSVTDTMSPTRSKFSRKSGSSKGSTAPTPTPTKRTPRTRRRIAISNFDTLSSSTYSLSSASQLSTSTSSLSSSISFASTADSMASSTHSLCSVASATPPRSSFRISKCRRKTDLTPRASTVRATRTTSASKAQTSASETGSYELTRALAIFQHPYFTRKWTFQEIILAQAAIFVFPLQASESSSHHHRHQPSDLSSFVDDNDELAFSDLASWYFHHVSKVRKETLLYDSLGSFGSILGLRRVMERSTMQIDFLHRLTEQREDHGQQQSPNVNSFAPPRAENNVRVQNNLRLSHLLMVTRDRASLKAEDAIYALLGLHRPFASYLREITEEEGWLPLPELFLVSFRFCIEHEGDLSILSAAGLYRGNRNCDVQETQSDTMSAMKREKSKRGSYADWPSWLPDWRESFPLRPLIMSNGMETDTSDSGQANDYAAFGYWDGHAGDAVRNLRRNTTQDQIGESSTENNDDDSDDDDVFRTSTKSKMSHNSRSPQRSSITTSTKPKLLYNASGSTKPIYSIHGTLLDDTNSEREIQPSPHSASSTEPADNDDDDDDDDDDEEEEEEEDEEEEESPKFILKLKGFRIGTVLTREGTWPNVYFVPNNRTQRIFDHLQQQHHKKIESTANTGGGVSRNIPPSLFFSSSTSSPAAATSATTTSTEPAYRHLKPLRTSTSTRSDDIVVLLYGGKMLYILRPSDSSPFFSSSSSFPSPSSPSQQIPEDQREKRKRDGYRNKHRYKSRQRHRHRRRYRYVGECSIEGDGIMNGGVLLKDPRRHHDQDHSQENDRKDIRDDDDGEEGEEDEDDEIFELF